MNEVQALEQIGILLTNVNHEASEANTVMASLRAGINELSYGERYSEIMDDVEITDTPLFINKLGEMLCDSYYAKHSNTQAFIRRVYNVNWWPLHEAEDFLFGRNAKRS